MKSNVNYLKHYNKVSDDIKYVSNSLIRLKILNALYDKPSDMKQLTASTKLQYSSVSTTLHGLELRGMIYRRSNKYYLVNSLKLQMKNIIQLAIIINLLEEIFNIVSGHVVSRLPQDSILELHLLNQAELLESEHVDMDKIANFIENTLIEANSVRCILPVYYEGFNNLLNDLVREDKFVELKVSRNLFKIYKKKSKAEYLSSFKGKNNFLLIITDTVMILGFFKEDHIFDTNRILISTSKDALKWANNLFRYFKKLNK